MIDFLLPGSIGYLVVKSLHIIAVIFWMAGMLYLPRLFVYHHQAKTAGELEGALLIQERNLLKILTANRVVMLVEERANALVTIHVILPPLRQS